MAQSNPFLGNYLGSGGTSVKGASYKGEQMQSKLQKYAATLAGAGHSIGVSVVGSSIATLLSAYLLNEAKKRKRESNVGRNWDKLIKRYPEFNSPDSVERNKVQDIFEGLNAMSPEITEVPVLAAPLLRNAMEYGMQGFSPADMKTLTDINSKMEVVGEPGIKMIPRPEFGTFANLPEAGA